MYPGKESEDVSDPNFLVIGAQKCGTTWLERMLKQHPDVYAPETKELHFFNDRARYERDGMEWYRARFAGHAGQKAVGEFTPGYYWVALTPEDEREHPGRIRDIHETVHRHYPDLRLILMLRNPVERAVSAWFHHIRKRRISPRTRFRDAWGKLGIRNMGFYHRNLVEWMKLYPKERFLVLIFEQDVLSGDEDAVRRVCRHLEIDDQFKPTSLREKFNRREAGTYLHLNYYLGRAGQAVANLVPGLRELDLPKIEVPPEDRRELHRIYSEENRALEELLGRDLSAWNARD